MIAHENQNSQPRLWPSSVAVQPHRLLQLISTKYNHSRLNKTHMNTEQITQAAISLEIKPPYRPIALCKGTLTEHISRSVDSILQSTLLKIPSFLKDTTDILCKLIYITHLVTPDSLLVTMDVNFLHTNIPHSDGVEACRSFLTMSTTDQTLINDIPKLVEFILKHNQFVFDDELYLQINGTAMGKEWHQHTPIFLCVALKIHFFLHLIYNQLLISDISTTFFYSDHTV